MIENKDKFRQIKKKLYQELCEAIDLSREVTDCEMMDLIIEFIAKESQTSYFSLEDKKKMGKELFDAIRKMDVLQDLLERGDITEIMVNGKDSIFIEKEGRLTKYDQVFESTEKLEDVIQQIVAGCNRVVNESSPIVDARLSNGSRVNIVLPPVALNGPIITIRRFAQESVTMDKLVELNALSVQMKQFLTGLVQAGYNILISGGTGSGKTTFLNALSDDIPNDERIITIEDNAELQIKKIPNIVRLEVRNANVEGCREITIRDLIKTALRMRPTRIIIGEVRGKEALDLLQCLNTGHDGSLSTVHANSARDLLSRLETMVLMAVDLPLPAIRGQIASGIDIIVHLGRLRDKTRKVIEIVEVLGMEEKNICTQTLFQFVETGESGEGMVEGEFQKKEELRNVQKWERAGIYYQKNS